MLSRCWQGWTAPREQDAGQEGGAGQQGGGEATEQGRPARQDQPGPSQDNQLINKMYQLIQRAVFQFPLSILAFMIFIIIINCYIVIVSTKRKRFC